MEEEGEEKPMTSQGPFGNLIDSAVQQEGAPGKRRARAPHGCD